MIGFNENQKIKDLVKAAQRDPDAASAFYFGDGANHGGAIIVIKPLDTAEAVVKWLMNQGLTTSNPIPKESNGAAK